MFARLKLKIVFAFNLSLLVKQIAFYAPLET